MKKKKSTNKRSNPLVPALFLSNKRGAVHQKSYKSLRRKERVSLHQDY